MQNEEDLDRELEVYGEFITVKDLDEDVEELEPLEEGEDGSD